MRHSLYAFIKLSWSARIHIVEAAMTLTFVMLVLRMRGYRRTRNTLARLRLHKQPIPHNDAAVDALVGELAWSLAAVSHHYPISTTCLPSLSL